MTPERFMDCYFKNVSKKSVDLIFTKLLMLTEKNINYEFYNYKKMAAWKATIKC